MTSNNLIQYRVLTLNDCEHQQSTIYRLQKNWILVFRLGSTLLGRKVALFCNYPIGTCENGAEPSSPYEFNTNYTQLKWRLDDGCENADDSALKAEIRVEIAGSFHYYFTYPEGEHAIVSEKSGKLCQGSGYFLVDPILTYGEDNEELPLDCIQCQTVLSKCLGPFDTWLDKLKVTKETGYNMVHFTPIQTLGRSKSSYSLCDQMSVNPQFGSDISFDRVKELMEKCRNEWKLTSICDIVLNHTANESQWILDHPESTYNCYNCPYLRPAYLLDAAFNNFSHSVKTGQYEYLGIPAKGIHSEDHLNAIRHQLKRILSEIRLTELFQCNVEKLVEQFELLAQTDTLNTGDELSAIENDLKLIQDPEFRRFGCVVNMDLALEMFNRQYEDCYYNEAERLVRCTSEFRRKLTDLNRIRGDLINTHLMCGIENTIAGIRYYRVQRDGPKYNEISEQHPLIYRYFTDGKNAAYQDCEQIAYSDKGRFLMAHNGWVMDADPLKNFAAADSNVYLRRELISWGDSVKLRYGDCPADNPFLWDYMRRYVEQTARIFDGLRLDNCHSTPIVVAEYLLNCARRIRSDLYVVAELFTNSSSADNVFVNRLGITSLIREAQSAWDCHEQGRLVYRFGGCPVGSFLQPRCRPLQPAVAHALFLDLTHDNPSPIEKRSVFDTLSSTALVSMACCASGSNRGYDELVPHHIHVVEEFRQYCAWSETTENMPDAGFVTHSTGIIAVKKALNDLHFQLGRTGFEQVYVDQMDSDIVAITRHCPKTHQSYILVAFTAFSSPSEDAALYQRDIKPLKVEGVLDEIVLEAKISHNSVKDNESLWLRYKKPHTFCKDLDWISGLNEYKIDLKQHIELVDSDVFEPSTESIESTKLIQLNFRNFHPGDIVIIKVSLSRSVQNAVGIIRDLIEQHQFDLNANTSGLKAIIDTMSLLDLNRALYRCDPEERDEGHGFGTYNIPTFGPMVYAGLQGFMSLMASIRLTNDLGHPMCCNLRDGNWMIDYIWQRLILDEGTKSLGTWFQEQFRPLKEIPRYLIPCYFDLILTGVYCLLMEHSFNSLSSFVKNGSTFVKALAMGSIQFAGYVKSAVLPDLSPNLLQPPNRLNNQQICCSLAAGLPHFSTGYMRNWGRDTFIALRGLFLLTGRYQDARYHILAYAACLRHGLIPNLLDGGRKARYNCRDAIWWWAYCIKCYSEEAPDGVRILKDPVVRLFPTDNDVSNPEQDEIKEQLLEDVLQEALIVHFQGLSFRERNAGPQIDEHMVDNGFNNVIGVDYNTGFVYGGNLDNCGTWMDKMGSSQIAGNRGKPATPRDGSAVELIGLSKSIVTWLAKLHECKRYRYDGVNTMEMKWTFAEWSDRIQSNFEKYFWINIVAPSDGDELRSDLINRRAIYKDCFGAKQPWCDFQLRCNFPIAMVVAPELFTAENAWMALDSIERHLLGPLGVKTLDPNDWTYRGQYDNSNDSNDFYVAQGYNYHQGPEWLWPIGFYLRARLQFAQQVGRLAETMAQTKIVLSTHFTEVQTSIWRGLPELTNDNGSYCQDSSRTQAWSMSCILEVLYDLQQLERTQKCP